MRGIRRLFLLCGVALSVLLAGCSRQEAETPEEKAAREAREAVEKATRTSVTDEMALRFIDEKLKEMAVVPGLGDFRVLVGTEWSRFPAPPVEAAMDIQKRVREAGEARVDQALRAIRAEEDEIRKALTAAAEAAHPMFKTGDEVELTLVRKGAGTLVSGRLGDVGADNAMVGRRMVPKIDLSEEDQARIFPAEHAAMIRRIVDKQFARRLAEGREAAEEGLDSEVRQALLAGGYVPDIAVEQEGRADARRWTGALALVKRVRQFLQSPAGRAFDDLLDELEE